MLDLLLIGAFILSAAMIPVLIVMRPPPWRAEDDDDA